MSFDDPNVQFVLRGPLLGAAIAAALVAAGRLVRRFGDRPRRGALIAWPAVALGAAVAMLATPEWSWPGWPPEVPDLLIWLLPLALVPAALALLGEGRRWPYWTLATLLVAAALWVSFRWSAREPWPLWYLGALAAAMAWAVGCELAASFGWWRNLAFWAITLLAIPPVLVTSKLIGYGQAWGLLAGPLLGAAAAGLAVGNRFLVVPASAVLALATGLLLAHGKVRSYGDLFPWTPAVLLVLAPWPLALARLCARERRWAWYAGAAAWLALLIAAMALTVVPYLTQEETGPRYY